MTVVRLSGGKLLLHSPCQPLDELIDAIREVGTVSYVVAPNWFHDLYLAQYRKLFPKATFWGSAFLKRQHKSLIDVVLDQMTQTPWAEEMPHVTAPGLLTLDESVFFHRPTRTLIVADLLMNASMPAETPPLTRLGYRFLGLDGTLKVFPVLKWFGLTDRASLRRAARQMLRWEPKRLVVGHGTPIAHDARADLQRAFAWLNA
jgi:hypothetical protein